jgi:dTDP-glucose 4,6-dehydratase
VYGEGTNIRDWLYVIDHCSAILTVMDKGRVGETYNIGARNEWRNIDIVNLVCDTVDEFIAGNAGLAERYPHKGARRGLIRFVKDRPGHDLRYAIDPSKIEAGLGWRPATDFRQGVRDTVKWYLENEEWWARIISGEYMNYYKGQYTERLS